ncbi:CgeB family protein [Actinobacillus porcinus]|uniref:CgeB family protein n=1 Tax=Actinobacillus porcinus TaxID=51048 RepID=UPI0023527512|nr:glycosyltransferase [Actinobacillus porcinus]
MGYLDYLNILVVSTFNRSATGNQHIINGVVEGILESGVPLVEYCFVENVIYKVEAFSPRMVLFLGPGVREDVDYGSITSYLKFRGVKSVFWITDDPYEFDSSYRYAKYFDVIFTNDLGTLPYYFHARNVHHLPLAASKNNDYRKIQESGKDIDLFFCGYPYKNRKVIMEELCKYINPNHLVLSIGDWNIEGASYIDVNNHEELINLYARCKYVINVGRTYNIANDYFSITATTPGPRTFEAALAGAAQIYISNGMEIENYYDINTEIVLSHDVREVADIINQGLSSRNYLDIAKAAQDRTIEEHLYTERVKAMFKLMREIF